MVLLLVWLFGALIGYDASVKRGFSPVAGVLGGFPLRPPAVLVCFVSGLPRPQWNRGPNRGALSPLRGTADSGALPAPTPLSDAQLSKILGKRGIVVARPPIAKSRKPRLIPPVRQRRAL